jgi:transcription-repair coupling factor (superfamily II helicase)
VPEARQRIDLYRKLAQATDRAGIDAIRAEARDRFGPIPAALERLLTVTELRILAADRQVTTLETRGDRLMLTRHGDFLQVGGRFPRLTRTDPKGRLTEIRKLLLAI